MLNIVHYQRNAKQNHNEISPHTVTMTLIKKFTNSVGEDMEKKESWYTVGMNVS